MRAVRPKDLEFLDASAEGRAGSGGLYYRTDWPDQIGGSPFSIVRIAALSSPGGQTKQTGSIRDWDIRRSISARATILYSCHTRGHNNDDDRWLPMISRLARTAKAIVWLFAALFAVLVAFWSFRLGPAAILRRDFLVVVEIFLISAPVVGLFLLLADVVRYFFELSRRTR
jgi:hypothetical protein